MRVDRIQAAVLRVTGEFDGDALSQALGFPLCQERQPGDVCLGRVYERHFANFLIAEDTSIAAASHLLILSVQKLPDTFVEVWAKIHKQLDFSVHIREEMMAAFVAFEPLIVAGLADIQVEIELSIYKVSD